MTQTETESSAVLTERRGRTLVITINRPEARNAVNGDVAQQLEAAVDELENDIDLWSGVLTGAGETFSAGADLKVISSGGGAELTTARGNFAGYVRRERTKPIIAAVNGAALAGGCEIALASDLIVAAEGVKMGLPEVKRSLMAVAGALVHLPDVIGEKLALEMAMTGEPVAVERLHQIGFVSRVVPAGEVLDAALDLAETINANAPLAVRASRAVVLANRDRTPEERWSYQMEELGAVASSEDFREGPLAFIEKRDPVWKAK